MNSDILIPMKPGTEYTLDKFGTIQVGYYRCTIESENPDFSKIFVTSKNNMYTHLSVIFAYENKDEYKIKIIAFFIKNNFQKVSENIGL